MRGKGIRGEEFIFSGNWDVVVGAEFPAIPISPLFSSRRQMRLR
jgi:hypothetical protein